MESGQPCQKSLGYVPTTFKPVPVRFYPAGRYLNTERKRRGSRGEAERIWGISLRIPCKPADTLIIIVTWSLAANSEVARATSPFVSCNWHFTFSGCIMTDNLSEVRRTDCPHDGTICTLIHKNANSYLIVSKLYR